MRAGIACRHPQHPQPHAREPSLTARSVPRGHRATSPGELALEAGLCGPVRTKRICCCCMHAAACVNCQTQVRPMPDYDGLRGQTAHDRITAAATRRSKHPSSGRSRSSRAVHPASGPFLLAQECGRGTAEGLSMPGARSRDSRLPASYANPHHLLASRPGYGQEREERKSERANGQLIARACTVRPAAGTACSVHARRCIRLS